MDTVEQTIIDTAAQTLPAILTAAGAANPGAASAIALAPVALQLLQTAAQFQQAGGMTQEQLAALFATIGANIKTSHDAWLAATKPA